MNADRSIAILTLGAILVTDMITNRPSELVIAGITGLIAGLGGYSIGRAAASTNKIR